MKKTLTILMIVVGISYGALDTLVLQQGIDGWYMGATDHVINESPISQKTTAAESGDLDFCDY